jgi:hypothetical protein
MAFCDSHLFDLNQDGDVVHRRSGTSYADKVIDGVRLDTTLAWENSNFHQLSETAVHAIMVGDRISDDEILTSTKSPGKKRGDGKFYHKKKTKKTKKKFKTKSKRFNRRESKVAQELGDINMHTEYNAWIEHTQVFCDIQRAKEKQINRYWSDWEKTVQNNPGCYAFIELKVSLNWHYDRGDLNYQNYYIHETDDGEKIIVYPEDVYDIRYDIDFAGINRECEDPHRFKIALRNDSSFAREQAIAFSNGKLLNRYFFTYWDADLEMYKWEPLNIPDVWRNIFAYDPMKNFDIFKNIFELKGNEPDCSMMRSGYTYTDHLDDLDWEGVWVYMDYIRTRKRREYKFTKGIYSTHYNSSILSKYRDQNPSIEFMNS